MRGPECARRCYDDDSILIRAAADTLMISPPPIITGDQIEAIFAAIRRALHAIDDSLLAETGSQYPAQGDSSPRYTPPLARSRLWRLP